MRSENAILWFSAYISCQQLVGNFASTLIFTDLSSWRTTSQYLWTSISSGRVGRMLKDLVVYKTSTTGWSSGPSSPSASSQTSGQVDKVLYKNLVEMVPLVQSLMDHRVNKSFSHRASLIYTPTPSRDRSSKKNELANLQAHLKKAEDDAKASNQKVKKVEEDLDGLQRQIAAFISFFEIAEQKAASSTSQGIKSSEDVEIDPNFSIQDSDANCLYKETVEDENYAISSELDRAEVEEIEHARRMYLAAVIAAKNNPGEESLSLAADLRVQLQQFLLRPALENALDDQLSVQALSFPAS